MTTTQNTTGAATDCAKHKKFSVCPEYGTGLYLIVKKTSNPTQNHPDDILAGSMAFSVAKEICEIFNAIGA